MTYRLHNKRERDNNLRPEFIVMAVVQPEQAGLHNIVDLIRGVN